MNNKAIIFIHGLGSSKEKTWGGFDALLKRDSSILSTYDIHFFEYPASRFYVPYIHKKALRLQDLAVSLKTEIHSSLASYNEIALICHSMGGLVARRYLLEEAKSKNELKTIKLVYFAVPHTGAGLASIAKLLFPWQLQIKQLCKESDFLDELNFDWERNRLNSAFDSLYILGGQDKVVGRPSASHFTGNMAIEMINDKGHSDVASPKSNSDSSYVLLKSHLFQTRCGNDSKNLFEKFIATLKSRMYLSDKDLSYSVNESRVSIELNSSKRTNFFEYDKSYIIKYYWDAVVSAEQKIREAGI